jgi:hypothetical protein
VRGNRVLGKSLIFNKGAKINMMENLDGVIKQRWSSRVFISHKKTSRPIIAA